MPESIETIRYFQNIDLRTIFDENLNEKTILSRDLMMVTVQDDITKFANKHNIRLNQHKNHTGSCPQLGNQYMFCIYLSKYLIIY